MPRYLTTENLAKVKGDRRGPPIYRKPMAERTFGDIVFDSADEGRRWLYLCELVKKNVYRTVRRQVRVKLGEDHVYPADFYVEDGQGRVWYEDVKGDKPSAKCGYHYLPSWPTTKRLWTQYGRAPLLVTVWRKGHWHTAETIPGGRAE